MARRKKNQETDLEESGPDVQEVPEPTPTSVSSASSETVAIRIPRPEGFGPDRKQYVTINGVTTVIEFDKITEVPSPVAEVLRNARLID